MKEINSQLDKLGVDKITLSISLFSVLFIATFITYDTQFAQKIIDQSYQYIVSVFGPSYLILTLFCFFFLIFLCISRFGDYRLGGDDAETEFLPLNCNWIASNLLPKFDEKNNTFVEPYLPNRKIGIMHLAAGIWQDNKDMRLDKTVKINIKNLENKSLIKSLRFGH